MNNVFSTRGLFVCALLAHVPIGIEYAARMWNSGHYQFFPILILAMFAVYRSRTGEYLAAKTKVSPWTLRTLLALNLVLVAAATLIWSSFLGALSLALLMVNWIYACYGWGGIWKAAPVMALTLFIIPLPLQLDRLIVFRLQFLASELASWMLDATGQIHFREGVVLQAPGGGVLTEEACSGIRSLFSVLAAVALYLLVQRAGFLRSIALILCAFGWVIVGNALRVALVIYGIDHGFPWIAQGWPHQSLGVLAFFVIIGLTVGTDQILKILFGNPEPTEPNTVAGNPSPSPSVKSVAALGMALFLVIGIFGGLLSLVQYQRGSSMATIQFERLPAPDVADSPAVVADWRQTGFEHIHREEGGLQAEDSYVWSYRNDDASLKASLDCPWTIWHNLADCYSGLGWKTNLQHEFGSDESKQLSVITMDRSTGESALVIFCVVDRSGEIVLPAFSSGYVDPESTQNKVLDNLKRAVGLQQTETGASRFPYTTLQVYCPNADQLTQNQKDQVVTFFENWRTTILQSGRFPSTETPE